MKLFTILFILLQTDATKKVNDVVDNNSTNWFIEFIQNNPTIILSIITGLLLPLGLVYLNNRNNVRIKKLENQLSLDSKKLDKELNEEGDKKE